MKREILSIRYFIATVVALIFLLSSVSAFAVDTNYLDYDYLVSNPKSSIHSVSTSTIYGTCNGDYICYVDNDSNSLYVGFAINESNIYTNADVSVEFVVQNDDNSYRFSVGENGINDPTDGIEKLFRVKTNFNTISSNNGTYIIGMDIKNGSRVNNISVALYTEGKYSIPEMNNISVVASQKTTSRNSDKSPASKSARTTKSQTTKATKYYDPNVVTTEKPAKVYDSNATTGQASQQYVETTGEIAQLDHNYTLSKNSKSMIAVAIAFAVVAVLVAAVSIIVYNMKKKDE